MYCSVLWCIKLQYTIPHVLLQRWKRHHHLFQKGVGCISIPLCYSISYNNTLWYNMITYIYICSIISYTELWSLLWQWHRHQITTRAGMPICFKKMDFGIPTPPFHKMFFYVIGVPEYKQIDFLFCTIFFVTKVEPLPISFKRWARHPDLISHAILHYIINFLDYTVLCYATLHSQVPRWAFHAHLFQKRVCDIPSLFNVSHYIFAMLSFLIEVPSRL